MIVWVFQQLRICSGHFHGGEKKDGDVPVADPQIDLPRKVDLPLFLSQKTERSVPKNRNHPCPRKSLQKGSRLRLQFEKTEKTGILKSSEEGKCCSKRLILESEQYSAVSTSGFNASHVSLLEKPDLKSEYNFTI